MQTIQLHIEDDIYESLIQQGIDVKAKVYELIDSLIDDGYPSITTQEAKKRVNEAVERYQRGEGEYRPFDNKFRDEMNRFIESI